MFSSPITHLHALWRLLTEPDASVIEPKARHRARAIASTLFLTIALVLIPIVTDATLEIQPPPLVLVLVALMIAYVFSRTRYYHIGGIIAIVVLWVIPTLGLLLGYSNTASFVLTVVRLLLLALLFTYILFSLRLSIVLALLIAVSFLFAPESLGLVATDFLLTAVAVFSVFVITRQYDLNERAEAEKARHTMEERYRAIVEIQNDMILRWLPDRTITFVNQACCRYFGKPREALIGGKVLSMAFPEDSEEINRLLTTICPDHPAVTYECRVYDAAGEIRWHQWTDQAIFDGGGQIVEYQSAGRDISEIKRTAEAEREQRQFAEALADTAALISSTLNLDEVLDRILGQVVLINPRNSAEVLLIENGVARVARGRGHSAEEAYDEIMKLRLVVQDTPNLRTMFETGKALIIPDVLEYPGWVDAGASAWIRAMVGAPIRLEGETIGFLSMTSSTPGIFTERHAEWLQAFADQAAIAIRNARLYDEVRRHAGELEGLIKERTAELQFERERLRAILDGTGEGIFYTEREKIQYVNPAFCKLTGYTQAELVGQDYLIFYGPGDAEKLDEMRLGVRRDSVWRGELTLYRKDGKPFDAGVTIAVIGKTLPLRAVSVVRDISREKALQAQRTNLVAYASHELRTPITNMKTRLYLLRRRPEYLNEHLLILDEVTERMHHLVEDLLDISRLEHGLIPLRRENVVLQDVVHTVVTLQLPEAERKGLDLNWQLPADPIYVSADRERLIQVITNLVNNALNYTPEGGKVVVTVSTQDDQARIDVEDTGIGIAAENLPHIFQPFYRVVSQVEGTGLGLSIAKEIIDLHEGSLSVQSEPEHGSVFTILLPLTHPMR